MCGIIGYTGEKRKAIDVILSGLKTLEYRGYDSSGLCLNNGDFLILKAVGEVSKLEGLVNERQFTNYFDSSNSIGHVRWATHGGVTKENAHPHVSDNVCLVHNGIIDNWEELKNKLIDLGFKFTSETDTEVIVHLISLHLKNSSNLEAIEKTIKLLNGTYALAITFKTEPDKIYFAKNGSPLVIGLGEKEAFLASDTNAITPYTNQVIYLNDGQYGFIASDEMRIFNGGLAITTQIETIDGPVNVIDKGIYDSYMLKEIYEQPSAISRCIGGRIRNDLCHLGGFGKLPQIDRIHIIACGTSYYAGLTGAYLIEEIAKIPTRVELASEMTVKPIIVQPNTLYLAISQSGETYDIIECLKAIGDKAKVYGIINVVGSTIARMCGAGVYVHAGPEIAVASTKAFTTQVVALQMLALMLAKAKPSDYQIQILPTLLDSKIKELKEKDSVLNEWANKIAGSNYLMILGKGKLYPVALEGALKIKEIAHVPCEGFAAGEMKHGPIAMITNGTPVICLLDNESHLMKSAVKEVEARGAHIIKIDSGSETSLFKNNDNIPIFSSIVPLQLLAYKIAKIKGYNVDKPRNLAKSCTVK